MPLHSSGLFSVWRRCQAKIRPRHSFGYACGDFALPPCQPENRSLSVRQFILLEALNIRCQNNSGSGLPGNQRRFSKNP
jgi:hypothetical protein